MKVSYTGWLQKTRVIDTDQFWINHLNEDYESADKYWLECMKTGEAYCYGRNNPDLNLYYAEHSKFEMKYNFIPDDIWKIPNEAFQKLLKLKGL